MSRQQLNFGIARWNSNPNHQKCEYALQCCLHKLIKQTSIKYLKNIYYIINLIKTYRMLN